MVRKPKISLALKNKYTQSKNWNWRGDKVKYSSLHQWVLKYKGNIKLCQKCGITTAKKYEWANIDHKYRRVLDDYIRLCCSCHRLFDNKGRKLSWVLFSL